MDWPLQLHWTRGEGYRSTPKVSENYKCRRIRMGKAVLGGHRLPLSFPFTSCSLNLCWVWAFWLAGPDSVCSHPPTGCAAIFPDQTTPLRPTPQAQHVQFSLPVKCCYAAVILCRKEKNQTTNPKPYRIIKTIHSLLSKKAKKLTPSSVNRDECFTKYPFFQVI